MENKKDNKKKYLKIVYQDKDGRNKDVVLPYGDDEYNDNLSYRENMQEAVAEMAEQGGFWLDKSIIIPFHKIQSVEIYKNANQPNEGGNITNDRSEPKQNKMQRSRFKRRINTGPKNVQG